MASPPSPGASPFYARVAAQEQGDATLRRQLTALRAHATEGGLTIAGEYVDDGVSGNIAFRDRPAGRQVLADAADGQFSDVVVTSLDRLGRAAPIVTEAVESLERLGVTVRSASQLLTPR